MLTHKVVMVLMLMSNDGTLAQGVIPFKDYDSCYASLKWTVDTSRYVHADRVCMSAKAFDNVAVLEDKQYMRKSSGIHGGTKINWYPPKD